MPLWKYPTQQRSLWYWPPSIPHLYNDPTFFIILPCECLWEEVNVGLASWVSGIKGSRVTTKDWRDINNDTFVPAGGNKKCSELALDVLVMSPTWELTSSASQVGQCVSSSSRQQCCKPLCSIHPIQKHRYIYTAATSEETCWSQGGAQPLTIVAYITGVFGEVVRMPTWHSNIIHCKGREDSAY